MRVNRDKLISAFALCCVAACPLVGLGGLVGSNVPAAQPEEVERAGGPSGSSIAGCTLDEHCEDSNACTSDVCTEGQCANDPVPGCVACQPGQVCPPLEVVFVVDTSGSMIDDAGALCADLSVLVQTLAGQGINISATLLGITEAPNKAFPCVSGTVVQRFGSAVPGDAGLCPFPQEPSSRESWGPATAIVADRYPWSSGSIRLVVPVGDEGPCAGNLPDGCNDPGDDRSAVDNAVAIAQSRGVIVSPILGTGADACTLALASDLATGTGGVALQSANAKAGLLTELTRIFTAACVAAEECSDGNPCTSGDACDGGVCVGTPVPGCRRCVFGLECRDSSACTTDDCLGGVCVNRAIANCTPCTRSSDCNDGNACTTNLCERGACAYRPAYALGAECCDPRTGDRVLAQDGNDCTLDICDPSTGLVAHPAVGAGALCDDGADCTRNDRCDGAGACVGEDLASIDCIQDFDCRPSLCDFSTGSCLCNSSRYLRLDDFPPPESECYRPGDTVIVYVVVGGGTTSVAGGQFLIQFDPSALRFVSAAPGNTADPGSPFVTEIFEDSSRAGLGELFYAVGVPFFNPGTPGPAVMVALRFTALSSCRSTSLCFADANPRNTTLTDAVGTELEITPLCSREIVIDDGPPALTCPKPQSVNASAGQLTAEVHWQPPTAQDGCGPAWLSCAGEHASGANLSALAHSGGRLPVGRSSFQCLGEDACGNIGSCLWTIDVAELNTVEANVELAPAIAGTSLPRCIEFEFYSVCGVPPVVVPVDMSFGPPFDVPGRATQQLFNIPAGDYACVAARDPLHSLRGRAELEVANGRYVVNFLGDPHSGGNWLVGGNLDGSRVVDVLDFAVLVGQYLTRRPPGTTCGTVARHADINGDGLVDQLDFSFVHASYLLQEGDVCCSSSTASGGGGALMTVSVEHLRELGLADAVKADLDRNGFVDADDLAAFLAGVRPHGLPVARGGR